MFVFGGIKRWDVDFRLHLVVIVNTHTISLLKLWVLIVQYLWILTFNKNIKCDLWNTAYLRLFVQPLHCILLAKLNLLFSLL